MPCSTIKFNMVDIFMVSARFASTNPQGEKHETRKKLPVLYVPAEGKIVSAAGT